MAIALSVKRQSFIWVDILSPERLNTYRGIICLLHAVAGNSSNFDLAKKMTMQIYTCCLVLLFSHSLLKIFHPRISMCSVVINVSTG